MTANLDATGQQWIAALPNYTFDIKYRSYKKMLMLMDSLESVRSLEGMEHKVIFHGMIKTLCQSELLETEQCPLNESVALTTQEDVLESLHQATAMTKYDWHKAQQQNPTIKLAIQYLKSCGSKPAPQVLANPMYGGRYLKD